MSNRTVIVIDETPKIVDYLSVCDTPADIDIRWLSVAEAKKSVSELSLECDYLLLTSHFLKMLSAQEQMVWHQRVEALHDAGVVTCFHNESRPQSWLANPSEVVRSIYRSIDMCITRSDIEQELFAALNPFMYMHKLGITEAVVYDGFSVSVSNGEGVKALEVEKGDAFSLPAFTAGYLSARFSGLTCLQALAAGNKWANEIPEANSRE